jgi:hypothetical protein
VNLGFDVIRRPELADAASLHAGGVRLPETSEGFSRYDVIILGPCEIGTFSEDQQEGLYRFVAERGGGLLLLSGRTIESLPAWRDARVGALLPVLVDHPPARLWPPHRDPVMLSFEADVRHLFDANAFARETASPFYEAAEIKPAATVLLTAGDRPLVSAHRLGRGRVSLIDVSKLFLLYRADRQGGALAELICGLVAYLGRTPAKGAGLELFVERSPLDPTLVVCRAYVVDKAFRPAAEANVLLTVGERTVVMEPTEPGYYEVTIGWRAAPSVVATAQAEQHGEFLGERTIAAGLPALRDEMSCVDLDEPFLRAVADRVGGRYVHIEDLDRSAGDSFVPSRQVGTTRIIESAWPRWFVLTILCLVLSTSWFIRRAVGLV